MAGQKLLEMTLLRLTEITTGEVTWGHQFTWIWHECDYVDNNEYADCHIVAETVVDTYIVTQYPLLVASKAAEREVSSFSLEEEVWS